jgi:UDP-3-O-[3-hydroxymyristoyl] glucosamine N-acyltransferase
MAADPRFFPCAGPQTLATIAAVASGRFQGEGSRRFTGVASLQAAGPDEVSFIDHRRNLALLRESRAGAVVLPEALLAELPTGMDAIIVASAYLGFTRVARSFHPAPAAIPGVHPTAVVAPDAELGEGCEIGPYAVIGAAAKLGAGCIIAAHVVIGPGVELGAGCRLHPHTSVSHAVLGAGVVLHPGVRIGQEGFGLVVSPDGQFETMPQLGKVVIGDAVEVGANCCIDRGSQSDTVIGSGTRIDNLVQIGHNVQTGRGCVIIALAGISGSTVLGDHVTVAAQAGIAGHLKVGNKARIGAQAGVMADVPEGIDVVGSPALPIRQFFRTQAVLRKLTLAAGQSKTGEKT